MSTSQTFTKLPSPTGNEKISLGTFGYVTQRNRHRQYDVVIREFKKSGITQIMLANRMGKTADVVSRLLRGPQNWEADTFSAMLFAISGAVLSYSLEFPLSRLAEPIPAEHIKPVSNIPVKPSPVLNTQANDAIIEELKKQALQQVLIAA